MAFYDAVRQTQRINDSFHDQDCRIKLSQQDTEAAIGLHERKKEAALN
jgi:hypothetical protein